MVTGYRRVCVGVWVVTKLTANLRPMVLSANL